jgi:hypothetical protein
MPSPITVSLEVPYAENERQFLVLVVQTAIRTFRRIHASSADDLASTASAGSTEASACGSSVNVTEDGEKEVS